MINPGSYYARMGIWGEPTSGPSILDRAIETSSSLQGLQNQYYQNMFDKYRAQNAGLNTQENQQTLAGRIGAANVKNQTDMQIYPQMQQAKLSQEQQTVNEIMSRTGLNRAQATEAAARTGLIGAQTQQVNASMNPGYAYDTIYQQYQNSPSGSPRKSYFAGILNNMMGGGINPSLSNSKSTKSSAGTGYATVPMGSSAAGSQFVKDPRMGSTRAGAGGTYIDPETGEIVSTDTSTQSSRDQRAIAGADNIKQYVNKAIATLPQYQTAWQQGNVNYQKLSNFLLGTNYAGPSTQAEGKAAVQEAAEGFINSFGLNATGENVSRAVDILTPKFGESSQQAQARMQSQLQDFVDQENRAKARLQSGNPVGQNPPQQMGGGGTFDAYGFHPNPSQQSQPNPQAQSPQNPQTPTDADIQYTAQKYNLPVDEVRRRLGVN